MSLAEVEPTTKIIDGVKWVKRRLPGVPLYEVKDGEGIRNDPEWRPEGKWVLKDVFVNKLEIDNDDDFSCTAEGYKGSERICLNFKAYYNSTYCEFTKDELRDFQTFITNCFTLFEEVV
jgi:hypothetical protein